MVQPRSKDGVFLCEADTDPVEACIAEAALVGGGMPWLWSIEECRLLWFMLRIEAAEGRMGEPIGGEAGVWWMRGDVASMTE
jgi:hypothetical protein